MTHFHVCAVLAKESAIAEGKPNSSQSKYSTTISNAQESNSKWEKGR